MVNLVLIELHGEPLSQFRATRSMHDTQDKEISFVIPTHRLREVGATLEAYDEHFWRNGHSVRLIIFDDSTPVNQQKYYSLLEQTCTHQPVYYVGPREKEEFIKYLNSRLRDRRR